MSNRFKSSQFRMSKRLYVSASVMLIVTALSGCSSFSRFDFPIFGLDEEETSTSSIQSEDVNRVYPPMSQEERDRRGSYYSSIYSTERETRSDVERSDLPEPRSRRSEREYAGGHDNSRYGSYRSRDSYPTNRRYDESRSSYSDYRAQRDPYRSNSGYGDSYGGNSDNASYNQRLSSDSRERPFQADPRTTGSLIVQKGDTLYSLAKDNNVSLSDLKEVNGLENNVIHIGQQLILPKSEKRSPRYARYVADDSDRYRERRRQRGSYSRRREIYENQANRGYKRPERKPSGYASRYKPDYKPKTSKTPKKHVVIREPNSVKERKEAITTRKPDVKPSESRKKAEQKRETSKNNNAAHKQKNVHIASRTETRTQFENSSVNTKEQITMPKTSGRFRWPVRGRIISKFGAKRNGARNDGINLSVPYGTDVKAAESGVVAYAGNELKGYGNLVLIRHRNKWVSAYAHNSKVLVRRGQRIRRGQIIAKAGKSGSVSQPQVHFELRKDAKPVDPLKYM